MFYNCPKFKCGAYEVGVEFRSSFSSKSVSTETRGELLDAFLKSCHWVPFYYLWRPNLPDEGDNHVLELAVAGGAVAIITFNKSDFLRAELNFPNIAIQTPKEFF